MEADVYNIDGSVSGKVPLPSVFETHFNKDNVLRALLAEQSKEYQPQGRDPLAGLRTSAVYVGRYGVYRTGRHMGIAIRPRQKLAKGAMGEVRRIPSARKGRRAHPAKVEKKLVERINRKEYEKAIAMAIAATADAEKVKQRNIFEGKLPIVVDASIEQIDKTKKLYEVLSKLGLEKDLERAHRPELKPNSRRLAKKRYFKKSAVIIAKDASKLKKAGENIPGIDIASVDSLTVGVLAPGGEPRLAIWTLPAIKSLEEKNKVSK
ncbi:MAG: 50S ribosomal protein L4 [Candidatus Micrarchaeia archaeon]